MQIALASSANPIYESERGIVSAKKNEILEIYSLDTMDGFMFFALTTACVSRTNHLIY